MPRRGSEPNKRRSAISIRIAKGKVTAVTSGCMDARKATYASIGRWAGARPQRNQSCATSADCCKVMATKYMIM